MSYSKLTAQYIPVAKSNYGSRGGAKIDTITIHHMAGNLSLQQCHDVWTGKTVSTNYGIDSKGNIGCFVDEENRSFASCSSSNDARAITIEVANDQPTWAGNWHCSDVAIESLVNLLVDVCQRYEIPKLLWKNDPNLIGQIDQQNMTVHQWFWKTACPGPYLMSIMGDIADRVNAKLGVVDDDLTADDFSNMFTNMRESIQAEDGSNWSEAARSWATSNKVFNGNDKGEYMWKDFCSREQVAMLLYNMTNLLNVKSTTTSTNTNKTNAERVWDYVYAKLGNKYATAGVMGNLYAESGFVPNNLQNTYNTKFNMTDEEYTTKVDNGKYKNFVKDSAGYGICQWTYWSRKQGLLEMAQERGVSIADLDMQLDYFWKELTAYGLVDSLKNASSIRAASDIMMLKFEKPLNQSEENQKKRASFGEQMYEKYGK